MRDEPVTEQELRDARDFLVGVFPLRFETAGAVVGSLASLAVHDLPDDELVRYRDAIRAVTIDGVAAAARAHINLDEAAVILVGDVDVFGPALETLALAPIAIERDDEPADGPIDAGDEAGPVEDAEPDVRADGPTGAG